MRREYRSHGNGAVFVFWPVLLIILIASALLRFSHADWDGGNQLHPDERAILFVANTIECSPTLRDAFNPNRSALNPFRASDGSQRSYPYGHLPLYLTVAAQRALAIPCSRNPGACNLNPETFLGRLLNITGEPRFTHLTYTGRAMSALFDTLTVLAAALLGRRLFDQWAGLLAAAFTGTAVLHIQNAHFGTVDTALAFWVTMTLWMLVRHAATGALRDNIVAGACAGLALACKVSAWPLVIPLLASHLSIQLSQQRGPQKCSLALAADFWLASLAMFGAFAATNPFALLDPMPFGSDLLTQARLLAGELDWPFTRQFTGTVPLWYYVEQQVRWGLGLPLTLAAYAGLGWATWQAWKTSDRSLTVVIAWALITLLTVGFQKLKFPRYMLPLIPVLLACAAGMIVIGLPRSARRLLPPRPSRFHGIGILSRSASTLAGLFVVIPSALYALAFTNMYRMPHPWITASQWIYHSLPPGTTIAVERWDDPLPLDIIVDEVGYVRERVFDTHTLDPFAEPDNEHKIALLVNEVTQSDYVILSSNRLYGVIPRLRERYPLTSAYYCLLFSGDLGFTLHQSWYRTPALGPVELLDDPFTRVGLHYISALSPVASHELRLSPGYADESFTVYDHPLALLFANESRLPASEVMARILDESDNRRACR